MLFRTKSGELARCNRNNYINDKEYYRAIISTIFNVENTCATMDVVPQEASKIANLVKTKVYNSHK